VEVIPDRSKLLILGKFELTPDTDQLLFASRFFGRVISNGKIRQSDLLTKLPEDEKNPDDILEYTHIIIKAAM